MAIYHCSIKIGSRSNGQSAIAAAAYRSGDKLKDNETGQISDYTKKSGIVFSEISLCDNAPAEYSDREILWNSVHSIEKNKNAQLWREFEVALPQELNREEQKDTVRRFVKGLNEQGMCVDWSLHDKGDGNPHAHIMATMRSITENGKWAPKSRKVYDLDENGQRIFQKVDKSGSKQYKNHKEDYNDWNKKERVEEWRAAWADCCNAMLSEENKIDHRSYERQGIDQIPTIHEGYAARKIAAAGGTSERVEINNEIREKNSLLQKIASQLKTIGEEIKKLLLEQSLEKGSAAIGKLLQRSRLLRDEEKVRAETRKTENEKTISKITQIIEENPTGRSDTAPTTKAETPVMEQEIRDMIELRNQYMRQAMIIRWLNSNTIKTDAQDDLRKAKELEENFESYAAEYLQKYGTARSYKRCIEYPPQFPAEEKLNRAAKTLQDYLGFMVFPFIASYSRVRVMENLDSLRKYVKRNMDKKQKAADDEIEKNNKIEELTAKGFTEESAKEKIMEFIKVCANMPEELKQKARNAYYRNKIPNPLGKFMDSKIVRFCNNTIEKNNIVVDKYMPEQSNLNQQARNDDNNSNYRGGRTR